MDTSETYVKMCEKAGEIQEQRRDIWETGDFFSRGLGVEVHCDYDAFEGCTWLPRQDQLQEMIPLKMSASWLFLDAFIRDYMETIDESYDFPSWDSWEQLWLAFVMKECYNKLWVNEEWETIK